MTRRAFYSRLLAAVALGYVLADESAKGAQNEQCSSYPQGNVYPGGRSFWEHSLSGSKAQIGKPAPPFKGITGVFDQEFKEVSLSDYKGKYVILLFYPLDFTFVCPTEITAFSDSISKFKSLNTEVLALSVDSQYTHLAWVKTPRSEGGLGPVKIPLLSDLTHQVSKDYGVYLEDAGHTLRGLFIIDANGILRQITINDLPVGRSVNETIRLVQAFQHTDTNGEVCPCNWQPGSDSIRPTPTDKLEYFKKHPGADEAKNTKDDKRTSTKDDKTPGATKADL
ncbi:hypothetical protein RvY_00979 [Ramazzottius varieornatus]|uniref:thioredoxin-dependent peroxiredoxin n=1 Tax=Ramazzottius varieornatus TaxID=947166 RepID=A0A1D1UIB0_RAMVA|nr:hypothetical protein RvY_00979 [Ramazzottius varieornatus]